MTATNPCLWFDGRAEEAARFYVSLFPNSAIDEVVRVPDKLPHNELLADIRNYLGTRWAGAVDWSPLQNRLELFPEVADALPDDPWQFDAFRANV
jgi:homospermidine synthase